jgi:CheY-like chemotaxis protein
MISLALRILILDSNFAAADALAGCLRAGGHCVVRLDPHLEDLQVACHFGPDIVLYAYQPGDADALASLSALRRLPGFDEVLMLLLADPAHAAEAGRHGHAVVCQPVGAATVMQVIAGAILAHSGLHPAEVIPMHGAHA